MTFSLSHWHHGSGVVLDCIVSSVLCALCLTFRVGMLVYAANIDNYRSYSGYAVNSDIIFAIIHLGIFGHRVNIQ